MVLLGFYGFRRGRVFILVFAELMDEPAPTNMIFVLFEFYDYLGFL
jgi:hypothetical protein